MYHSINEFVQDWEQERALTVKVLEALSDDSLGQAVSDAQKRTLGELGWHLVGALPIMLGAAGLQIDGPEFKRPTPTRAAEIVDAYRQMSDAVAVALKEQWSDEKLAENILLFGHIDTTYAGVLQTVVRHQIHHRGQMTILMRQAGVVPPGVYGPNEEEGAAIRAAQQSK